MIDNFGIDIQQKSKDQICDAIEDKLKAMEIYASELGTFPFPRSHQAISALATLRGAASGFDAAEAFELLRERS